jgi:hypothetical protein
MEAEIESLKTMMREDRGKYERTNGAERLAKLYEAQEKSRKRAA